MELFEDLERPKGGSEEPRERPHPEDEHPARLLGHEQSHAADAREEPDQHQWARLPAAILCKIIQKPSKESRDTFRGHEALCTKTEQADDTGRASETRERATEPIGGREQAIEV